MAASLVILGLVAAHKPRSREPDIYEQVKNDLKQILTISQPFWPADNGNYGGLFIRLAWHCAGSYRLSDGRGGCDGGRIRYDPEQSWPDNTNLDKARTLIWPVKQKYGDLVSWGDLIILAGNAALEGMGAPVLGFCGGRTDDEDGTDSLQLGPSPEQEALYPCPENGNCSAPLGPTTVGLIYVNPEGPLGNPDPAGSAGNIRDVFGRMGMNDSETVSLVGGGHAFGKAHGACPLGAGPSPKEQPVNPWPGRCGSGKGPDTFTSGFEGSWTNTPTKWGNAYFQNLINLDWILHKGPGGHFQWYAEGSPLMMLTADIALRTDPAYRALSEFYATNLAALNNSFSNAWYKLTTRDMGPRSRCLGNNVPPEQPWQYPLPTPSDRRPPEAQVVADIRQVATAANRASLVNLAWRCASTFRKTDYRGGCNGARIRLSPEKDWPENAGTAQALALLAPIKSKYVDLTWADLIVLAGNVALEASGAPSLPFCWGRTDAADGNGSLNLDPPKLDTVLQLREFRLRLNFTKREFTAFFGGLASLGLPAVSGNPPSLNSRVSNAFFVSLLANRWEVVSQTSPRTYKPVGQTGPIVYEWQLFLGGDAELLPISEQYVYNPEAFSRDFAAAWTKLMTADRYDGPTGNLCLRQNKNK